MNNYITSTLLSFALMIYTSSVFAYDIEIDGIYYTLSNNEAYVASPGNNTYSGEVKIPHSITYLGLTYNVTRIEDNAFYSSQELTSVSIPDGIITIGKKAFQGCHELANITFPNSITTIGEDAFLGCYSLENIFIPYSVTSIGERAFSRCKANIIIDERNTVYDNRNNCNAIIKTEDNILIAGFATTIIPNSVTCIGNSAFYGCIGLKEVIIPSNVISIGEEAFSSCTELSSVFIPENVTSIGKNAFYRCYDLTNISIPNSIVSLGNDAFGFTSILYNTFEDVLYLGNEGNPYAVLVSACTSNTTCVINPDCKCIGDRAFEYYTKLEDITIPYGVKSIGENAFRKCKKLRGIFIPSSVTKIGRNAFPIDHDECATLEVDPGNRVYDSRDNCNAIIETATNKLLFGCNSSFIPNSVVDIEDYAFYSCKGISTITIPSGVSRIGMEAFSMCTSLSDVFIPNSMKTIEKGAFSYCSSLKNINIPQNVTFIGGSAFSGCIDVSHIEVDSHNRTFDSRNNCNAIIETSTNTLIKGCNNTIIPNSVTRINSSAFAGCLGLTHIDIPNSVTEIANKAFYGCANLSVVTNFAKEPQPITAAPFMQCKCDTLYVLTGCKSAYEAAPGWNEFKNIIEIGNDITLNDGDIYNTGTKQCDQLTYSRTFSNTHWQALYVPFSIPVDSLSAHGLQVAELNDTHQWDFNGDGVADSTRVEFFTLTSGSTGANYPYLIRAMEPTTLSLTLKEIEVNAAEENSIECSSTKQKFTFVGTYTGVSGADMYDNNYYGMSGGGLKRVSNNTVSLKPQRWYMKIENKNGSPVSYYAPSIRFIVDGIEDEAETSDLVLPTVDADLSAPMYSIEGIRQTSNQLQPGLYLRQGKKIVIR